ncbi:MAG: Peptidoglycan/xylan/chitin deacetylase, PgdA/CDA1 family [Chloroflexi bacterium]|jgi:allantoinase|nr:MAG: Peptidoglycan/xylan/chitin deacetylase, PgdA/CDA1 family [Chloroflexota bacterium]
MVMERDFIGYGQNVPRVEWPNGERLAVSVVVNYEEGSEYSVLDGDSQGEGPPVVKAGDRDLYMESNFEYGSRAGVWRIFKILDDYDVKSTFFVCALALERNPDVAKEIVNRGHDIVGHGYRWEEYHSMDRETEKNTISKAVESIKRTTGQRPIGWYTRSSPSVNTRELLVEEGGFAYDCNSYADDIPFYATVKDRKWLVVPYTQEVNDYQFHQGLIVRPSDFYEIMRSAFDRLYEEGATHPKMMSIGLHCRMVGRPARALALAQFLEYAKTKSGVWFAGRNEIANWWLNRYPST